ncbi:NfeD family protein [Clostridium sp. MSJ-4]|uniref:NfeD family protein n=1 Tax=Clostridium simiarum TaxID=2841506 RepID=A0ABS6EYQ0_9CLOT|nr:NfeD family protein [Clostridium simiarum]MBU5590528.1 NfeD family protein [Clostridium simiarum]
MTDIIVWIIISAVALVADLVTSSLLFVWFTVAGVVAILAAMIGFSIGIQVILFLTISILLIITVYPMIKNKTKLNNMPKVSMDNKYLGKEFLAEKEIIEEEQMKIEGIYWAVKNIGDKKIGKEEKFKIEGIEGNKMLVKSVEQ